MLIVAYDKEGNVEFESAIASEVLIYVTLREYHNLSIEKTLELLELIWRLYMKDQNRTPLIDLVDFIAENYDTLRNLNTYDILGKFYYEN